MFTLVKLWVVGVCSLSIHVYSLTSCVEDKSYCYQARGKGSERGEGRGRGERSGEREDGRGKRREGRGQKSGKRFLTKQRKARLHKHKKGRLDS